MGALLPNDSQGYARTRAWLHDYFDRHAAGAWATLGQTYCGIGDANRSTSDWLHYSLGSNTDQYRLYGLSQEFTYVAVPAPGAIALLGVAGLVGRRRRG